MSELSRKADLRASTSQNRCVASPAFIAASHFCWRPKKTTSVEPEQEYFSDGISEDIITALSKLRWLFVIARNSSFTYKGKSVHMKQVAEELRRAQPNISLAWIASKMPIKMDTEREHYLEAFRRAGLD
jgi:hypothetical protein